MGGHRLIVDESRRRQQECAGADTGGDLGCFVLSADPIEHLRIVFCHSCARSPWNDDHIEIGSVLEIEVWFDQQITPGGHDLVGLRHDLDVEEPIGPTDCARRGKHFERAAEVEHLHLGKNENTHRPLVRHPDLPFLMPNRLADTF